MNPSFPPLEPMPMQKEILLSIQPIEVESKYQANPLNYNYLTSDYPYKRLGYGTLNKPSNITNLCYDPFNCPDTNYPTRLYNQIYSNYQKELTGLGTLRYVANWEPDRNDDLNGCPVFNSNMQMQPY
jgi:hypothetical protein